MRLWISSDYYNCDISNQQFMFGISPWSSQNICRSTGLMRKCIWQKCSDWRATRDTEKWNYAHDKLLVSFPVLNRTHALLIETSRKAIQVVTSIKTSTRTWMTHAIKMLALEISLSIKQKQEKFLSAYKAKVKDPGVCLSMSPLACILNCVKNLEYGSVTEVTVHFKRM